jgi:Holliday junction DNA helicase RuvA
MIGRIRGVLVSRRGETAMVDVAGVGYEVTMTPKALITLPGVGEEVVIHTHHHVREDESALFGFDTERDRDLFRILLTASGVGPKVGMALLATLDHDEIVRAVVAEDPDVLTAAPGVGKRGAQKIVLELAPKLAGREADLSNSTNTLTVRQALEGLGYSTEEINSVIGEVDPEQTIELQIRAALQALGRR